MSFDPDSVKIKGVSQADNSIVRAARILREQLGLKVVHVAVIKRLPICGGVGGGSSNSACFINQIFEINGIHTEEKLKYIDIFDELGCDNKVFLYKYFTNSKTVYLKGSGIEGTLRTLDLDLTGYMFELIFSKKRLSTSEVYKNFKGPYLKEVGFNNITLNHILNFNNSLQESAIQLCPELKSTLSSIRQRDPLVCGISGSGPTCFSMFYKSKPSYEPM